MVAAIIGSFLGIIVGVCSPCLAGAGYSSRTSRWCLRTIWAYLKLKDIGVRIPARIDWAGNLAFAGGLGMLLVA